MKPAIIHSILVIISIFAIISGLQRNFLSILAFKGQQIADYEQFMFKYY